MIKFIVPLGLFCILASYSAGHEHLFEKKPIKLAWADERDAKLASVYGLTPEEVSEPVNLWRKVK